MRTRAIKRNYQALPHGNLALQFRFPVSELSLDFTGRVALEKCRNSRATLQKVSRSRDLLSLENGERPFRALSLGEALAATRIFSLEANSLLLNNARTEEKYLEIDSKDAKFVSASELYGISRRSFQVFLLTVQDRALSDSSCYFSARNFILPTCKYILTSWQRRLFLLCIHPTVDKHYVH